MKLTTEQIDYLFNFTRQHYVVWYDLQSELVDHLANAIEAEWQENPKLSFEEAVNKEFRKFGVFGFMEVVEKRQAVLGKKYNRIVWYHLREFFGVPKIVLTILMTLVLFSILKRISYNESIIIGLSIISLVCIFYQILKAGKIMKEKEQTKEKRWLFEEIINQFGSFSGMLYLPLNILIQMMNHLKGILQDDYWILGVSFFFVLFAIVNYIVFKIIPSKAEEYLKTTYPEYNLSKV